MLCNKCGYQNNDNSRFCIGCGNPLEVISQPQVQPNINQINLNTPSNNQSMNSVMEPLPTNNQNINNISQNISTPNLNTNNQTNTLVGQNAPTNNQVKKEKKKINKKLLIIGISSLVLIVAVLVCLFIFGGNKKVNNDLKSIFDLKQPIPVNKDSYYAYINTDGKLLSDKKYILASDFYGDYAYVELQDGTSALIDKKENVKVTATGYYAIEYVDDYNLWLIDGVIYDSNLKPLTEKTLDVDYLEDGYFKFNDLNYTKYGIIGIDGKIIYETSCSIYDFDVKDELAIITTSCDGSKNEYLISLKNGKTIYENKYLKDNQNYYYYYDLNSSGDNIFYINDTNYDRIESFYVKNDEIVYTIKEDIYNLELYSDDYLEIDYGYYYEELGKEQRTYYYDLKNKKLLTEKPKIEKEEITIDIDKYNDSKKVVSCDTGKGLIQGKKVLVPCVYKNINQLENNVYDFIKQSKSMELFIVEDYNGNTMLYDASNSKTLINFDSKKPYDIYDYENSIFIKQQIYEDDSWSAETQKIVVYNLLNQKSVVLDKDSSIEIKMNYFTVSKNGKKIYYNTELEKIYTEG